MIEDMGGAGTRTIKMRGGMGLLGVPAYNWWNEALHGVAQGRATVFPQAIGLAAMFDAPLLERVAVAFSDGIRLRAMVIVLRWPCEYQATNITAIACAME